MNCRLVLATVTVFLVANVPLFAKAASGASADDAFWVAYWAKPEVALMVLNSRLFNENVHLITFAHDRFDHALDGESTRMPGRSMAEGLSNTK